MKARCNCCKGPTGFHGLVIGTVGTRDLEKAGKFYDAIAAVLGNARSATTERTIYYTSTGVGIAFACLATHVTGLQSQLHCNFHLEI